MAFRLSDKRCEEIKEIVVNTFEELNIRCIPISAFEMATKLGAVVVPYSSKSEETYQLMMERSEDGFTIKKDGVWYILYNDAKGYGRVNNTLTHESGHIVLDHTEESELAEAEAKFFAKYALAPPVLIHKLELKDAYEVYEHFDISLEAATYAFSYYRKWLTYGNKDYTNYEIRLLQLFKEAV
ncbi:MAG: ImmA/IrrE family metallo-endopeptidase [Clostridia bacterium]|nr:ImmA/IrrE family metallo-endopeptidase [Clostridia bacterium]MBQ7121802.1 ImmA/IrrE family metallo-endopeptidase [Clostridia bacterium]